MYKLVRNQPEEMGRFLNVSYRKKSTRRQMSQRGMTKYFKYLSKTVCLLMLDTG
jgi:hypothetical protein